MGLLLGAVYDKARRRQALSVAGVSVSWVEDEHAYPKHEERKADRPHRRSRIQSVVQLTRCPSDQDPQHEHDETGDSPLEQDHTGRRQNHHSGLLWRHVQSDVHQLLIDHHGADAENPEGHADCAQHL